MEFPNSGEEAFKNRRRVNMANIYGPLDRSSGISQSCHLTIGGDTEKGFEMP